MKLAYRDKRALMVLGIALCTVAFSKATRVLNSAPVETNFKASEERLNRLELMAANLPAASASTAEAKAALAMREKSLIDAADDKLAQEKLLNVVENLAQAQVPRISIRGKELGHSIPFGDYGKVSVTISTSCRIEQLVNFMSDLTAQPEAIAAEELHIYGVHPESKQMQVRLTIGGLVPARLIPKSKDLNEF